MALNHRSRTPCSNPLRPDLDDTRFAGCVPDCGPPPRALKKQQVLNPRQSPLPQTASKTNPRKRPRVPHASRFFFWRQYGSRNWPDHPPRSQHMAGLHLGRPRPGKQQSGQSTTITTTTGRSGRRQGAGAAVGQGPCQRTPRRRGSRRGYSLPNLRKLNASDSRPPSGGNWRPVLVVRLKKLLRPGNGRE
jgi:hypothetical protein